MKLFVFAMATLAYYGANADDDGWSSCSKSCGRGSQWKKKCIWGFCNGKSYRQCNTDACIAGWSTWSSCSKTCGGGTRYKVEKCASEKLYECPKTYGDCAETSCNLLSSCPNGQAFRYRDRSSCCTNTGGCGTVDKSVTRRIFGGEKARRGQWPWTIVVFDKVDNIAKCGASLIHPLWAVTAAHCVTAIPTRNMKLIFGTISIKNLAPGSVTRDVDLGISHPSFKFPFHDIGLLKFKTAVQYTANIRPVCLPSGEAVDEDKTCYAAGWGISNPEDLITRTPSDVLMQVNLRILPLDACKVGYANTSANGWTTNDNLCAGRHEGVKDTCTGDSGGPLLCQRCKNCAWFLAGVTSFGSHQCGQAGTPGVYVNVRHYQTWIEHYVPLGDTGYFTC